jgi:hypothetical protein
MQLAASCLSVAVGIGVTLSGAGRETDRVHERGSEPRDESPGFEIALPPQAARVTDIAVSRRGETVVAGLVFAPGFPVTSDALQRACQLAAGSGECQDGFLLILGAAGSVRYATYLGGAGAERHVAIAPATDGTIWALVTTSSTDLGQRSTITCNGRQPVLMRLSPETGRVDDPICVGGPRAVLSANDMALGPDGSVWVAATDCEGSAETVDAWQPVSAGACDVYVARYRAGQFRPLAATYVGGRHLDYPAALAITPDGDAVVTGVTLSRDFPTVRPFQPRHGGGAGTDEFNHDAFVVRLDVSGRWVEYSTFVGGAGQDHGLSLTPTADGGVVVAGSTWSEDFPSPDGSLRHARAVRDEEAFVIGFDAVGRSQFAALIGGDGTDHASGVSLLHDGSLIVVGQTTSADFPRIGQQAHGGSNQLPPDLPFLVRTDPHATSVWTSTLIPVVTGRDAWQDGWSPENQTEAVASDGTFVYLAGKTRVWTHDALDWTARETGHYLKKWRVESGGS